MSTAVLELKQKVERLTSEERYELMQILEDIDKMGLSSHLSPSSPMCSNIL